MSIFYRIQALTLSSSYATYALSLGFSLRSPPKEASSPSEAVVSQYNMHEGLCSAYTEAVIITQSEVIYSAQMSHHGEVFSSSR